MCAKGYKIILICFCEFGIWLSENQRGNALAVCIVNIRSDNIMQLFYVLNAVDVYSSHSVNFRVH